MDRSDPDFLTDSARIARRALSGAGRNDATLLAVLHQAIGIENDNLTYSPNLVKSLAKEASTRGDARRGKTVYLSSLGNCSTCHKRAPDRQF